MTFKTCSSAVHNIINETCDAIWDKLSLLYLCPPTASEWESIAKQFYNTSGLPNCVGAIDGKHVNIICPPRAASKYFNYIGWHSVVLMAACDAKYTFTFIDIGARGSESDGGVFSLSTFGQMIVNNELALPRDTPWPGINVEFPHFFVADAAFLLRRNIMKPYPGRLLRPAQTKYNYKISSARRLIENTFGIMCSRWRIMHRTLHCLPKNAVKIIKAVVTLHNFVKTHDTVYCPSDYVDRVENGVLIPGGWRSEISPLPSFRMSEVTTQDVRSLYIGRN